MRKSLHTGLMAGMLAMGLVAAPSFAEIKVNDQLSLSGFIDMSATHNVTFADEFSSTFDQFELDFMYKFSDVLSARVDLSNSAVEQGFLSYAASPSLTVQAGKFLSSSGFEAAEPTGMYQFSYSNALVYGGYQNGVNVSYALSSTMALYAALVDGIWTADGNLSRPGVEAQLALMPSKEITAKITGMYEQQPGYGKTVLNAWASYTAGSLTAAVEADYLLNYTAEDDNGIGYLLMVNSKLSDALAVTGRFSGMKTDAMAEAANEVTVSPSYALAANWLILAEAKYMLDIEELGLAVETTITF